MSPALPEIARGSTQMGRSKHQAGYGLEPARWLGGLLAAAFLLGLTQAASAQGAVRSVHGDWQIRCDTPPGAQGEQCALIQSVVAEDRSNAGLTVIVLKTADQKSKLMRVVAPLTQWLCGRGGDGRKAARTAQVGQNRNFYYF
jgi:hypothetical protein